MQKQRRIFTLTGFLVLVSSLSQTLVIPFILRDTSPGSMPVQAATATAVGAFIHLLLAIGFFIGARLAKLGRRINREINLVSFIVLLLMGFVITDGAFAFLDDLLFVSIGMFLVVFCDLAGAIISLAVLFILRTKKKN